MTDDLNKSVDVVVDDHKKARDETARQIIEDADSYTSELISKQLGYAYGNGYRAGINQFDEACRILAKHVVALRTGEPVGPVLDPTAQYFIAEAEKTWKAFKELKEATNGSR